MLNNYICALDLGSSKICGCVSRIKGKSITDIFFDSLPSGGLKQGAVVDSIGLVGSLSTLLKNLKNKSGINIKNAYVNISGTDIVTRHSRAVIALAERGNKVITPSDIQKADEQARILGSSLEEEIVHLIPYGYAIDSKSGIANPLGLYSHRLEADLYLICVKSSSLQSLSRVVHQSGCEIEGVFLSGLATSRVVFGDDSREGLNVLCDIGSDTTEILLFENGNLCDVKILAMGGDDFTNRLCEELKIPFELAEDIKRSYGIIGDYEKIAQDKEILVKKSELYNPIKQKEVCRIITDSGQSLCSSIKEALFNKVSRHEVKSFVAAGRTLLLEGLIETLENTLSVPVKLGRISDSRIPAFVREDSSLSGQKYLSYQVCLGAVLEALRDKIPGSRSPSEKFSGNAFLRAINKFKEVYQEYF